MGFTGKKALERKLKYIEAFNSLERQLTEIKLTGTYSTLSVEEMFSKALDERIEAAVNKILEEKVEVIVEKAVTKAVSETVKALAPYMKTPITNLLKIEDKTPCKARSYKKGKMFDLPPELRQQVDKMIISGEYSCQQIADFINENSDVTVSYMTISRYKTKYFIMQI